MSNDVILVTVSDDRSGRKGGLYGITQRKVRKIFENNDKFGISRLCFWNWNDISGSDFYVSNRRLLDNVDPALNGRCYKPYVIQQALAGVSDGDFVIYNDISPEWWEVGEDFVIGDGYQLDIIKNLCVTNGDILSCRVSWMAPNGVFFDHIHDNFTSERCMRVMKMESYRHCLQHASGMMVFRKSVRSVEYVNEWLKWNLVDECGGLKNTETGEDFWGEEVNVHGKIGHRHDQSISGLLVNRMGGRLLNVADWWSPSPTKTYNFLSFCKTDERYNFVDSVVGVSSVYYRNVYSGGVWKILQLKR